MILEIGTCLGCPKKSPLARRANSSLMDIFLGHLVGIVLKIREGYFFKFLLQANNRTAFQ